MTASYCVATIDKKKVRKIGILSIQLLPVARNLTQKEGEDTYRKFANIPGNTVFFIFQDNQDQDISKVDLESDQFNSITPHRLFENSYREIQQLALSSQKRRRQNRSV